MVLNLTTKSKPWPKCVSCNHEARLYKDSQWYCEQCRPDVDCRSLHLLRQRGIDARRKSLSRQYPNHMKDLEKWMLLVKQHLKRPNIPQLDEFVCQTCDQKIICAYAFDPHCLDECLAHK